MAENEGLVCAYLLDGSGGASPMSWDDISSWNPDQGVLWVHLDRTNEKAREWLRYRGGLEPGAVQALLATEDRPRSVSLRSGLLIFLRGVNLNPGRAPEDMVSVRMWLDPNRVISVRDQKLMATRELRSLIDKGNGPRDSGDILTMLGDLLVQNMDPVLTKLGDEITRLEREVRISASAPLRRPVGRRRLAALQKEAIALRRYLAPQQRALSCFEDEQFGFLDYAHRLILNETNDRITRYVENLDAEQERASIIHNQISDGLEEQMNRTMYLLSLIAGIFLPLSLVVELFGTNLRGAPGADYPLGFELLIITLVFLALAIAVTFRRLRWL